MRVIGIDACPQGWIGVVVEGQAVEAYFLSAIHEVGALGVFDVIAIDMPIGLPVDGYRTCDVAGKALLGARSSTLFHVPVQAVLEAPTHEEATAISQSLTGGGVSRQSYGLRHRIFEVAQWRSTTATPVYEVHPELSFLALTGRVMDSKKTWSGMVDRQRALLNAGIDLRDVSATVGRRAQPDDMVDAGVVAWSARRIALGQGQHVGQPPEPAIWW